jgi:hypothetical protein
LRKIALLGIAALLAACSSSTANFKSDWERQNEGRLARDEGGSGSPVENLPPFPRGENLAEIFVSAASDFRFFVDRTSLSVSKDRIVRYVLVARSPSGVDNVTYEGINCREAEYRIYAVGRSDGSWASRPGEWRPITRQSVQRWHNALHGEYFCPNGIAIEDAAEGARALQRGGQQPIR